MAAAVADFKPENVAETKIKRGADDMSIRLCPTRDIAATLGKMKQPRQTLVAFALETNDEETNAKHKLQKKNADFVVLNSLRNKGTCFRTDDNQIDIISENGKASYPKTSKQKTASYIVDALAEVILRKQQ